MSSALKSYRLGGRSSYQKPHEGPAAGRQHVRFACPAGHEIEVRFSDDPDVEVPTGWECSAHSLIAAHVGQEQPQKKVKPPRTHWDMLLERRTISELEEILEWALERHRTGTTS
ncbi:MULTISPECIES: RNA polymerase-binding protein RbpA [unclassified Crossiella]|uniref:RNA polymerase-binding protein RbpA n=1 Tax=unclassified Crossiella TaxID=2620835 RepID=UPI001FFF4772|nr:MULTISPECIES: RNA polymerase-binding protein RbpA [unclassified Crossiella]MCK2240995.1 RNA polymerase-binding protein RbpA [Crossiella sp. S99.2]MCK2253861.1 RNA polymerase-binding protein RbpA [Crossiella sp. S99.1]